jgi:hypothetical protein
MVAVPLAAQTWDIGGKAAESVAAHSEGKLKIGFENRLRYESRSANGFGKDGDLATGLERTRFSMTFESGWVRLSGMAQDSRAPWYGPNAPTSARDTLDLHEAYVELFARRKTGFGMTAGRMMLNYGEGRLLGTPQWGNCARTYDQARLFFKSKRARVDALFVSPVKIQSNAFNRPVLGDRVWGAYGSFPDLWRKSLFELYLLRRDQNRQGGFAGGAARDGTDRLRVNTLGFRLAGPLALGAKFSLEGAAQNGRVGPGEHRASAWFSSVGRRWTAAARPLDLSVEYKFASGARNPKDATLSRTFDQLYAANHDKFGHQDLFGWRNIHNARALATYGLTKALALNVMYSGYRLASPCDALYSGAGKSIAKSAACSAGSDVGREADVFAVYKYKRFQIGAGYGHFFSGEFIRKTTPGVGPSYVYIFHSYSL